MLMVALASLFIPVWTVSRITPKSRTSAAIKSIHEGDEASRSMIYGVVGDTADDVEHACISAASLEPLRRGGLHA